MSSPVSAMVTWFLKPPMLFMATFRSGGAGSPRVPVISTRSFPICSSETVSNREMTSGLAYAGDPISYNSWLVMVPTVTPPPVPTCFVMTQEPSAATSAMGNPTLSHAFQFCEERIVAAGGLGATLDDMTGNDRARELVPVVALSIRDAMPRDPRRPQRR